MSAGPTSRSRRPPSPEDQAVGPPLLLPALAAGLLLAAYASPAAGHPGDGAEAVDPSSQNASVLQAEAYDAADESCDPDGDGEHTRPKPREDAREGAHLFLPHSGCGVAFQGIDVAGPAVLERVRLHRSNCGSLDAYTMEVWLHRDGDQVATAPFDATPEDCGTFRTVAAEDATTIPEGNATLRLEVHVTDGPYWANAKVDQLAFGPAEPADDGGPLGDTPSYPPETSDDTKDSSGPSLSAFQALAYASPFLALGLVAAARALSGGDERL